MAEVLYNRSGVPLIGYGSRGTFIDTTGAPDTKPKTLVTPKQAEPEKTSVGNIVISNWGSSNDFPSKADDIINGVGVLNSGLKFTRNFTIGQGIFPVIVTGYDDNGNEILKPVDDIRLRNFGKSRLVRRYLEKAVLLFSCCPMLEERNLWESTPSTPNIAGYQ